MVLSSFLPCLPGLAAFSALAMTSEPRDLGALVGEYRDTSRQLTIRADGSLAWDLTHLPAGTDATMQVKASGRLRIDADAVSLLVDEGSVKIAGGAPAPADAARHLPTRVYPVSLQGVVFLLTENDANGIANMVNGGPHSPIDALAFYLHSVRAGATRQQNMTVDPEVLMPKAFAKRLLAAPLRGKVLRIGDVTKKQVDIAGWMRPPEMRTQHAARLSIDLGAAHGVFQGMCLYTGSVPWPVEVLRVLQDRCEAHIHWIDRAPPQVGDPVFSAAR